MTSSSYAYGDTEVAAQRLLYLGTAFEEPSRRFLEQVTRPGVDLAIDLGCGIGATTALLREVVKPKRVVGLDSSPNFVAWAGGGEFLVHDVTRTPFPVRRADLIYCRMLLGHLQDPLAALDSWAAELASGGRLLYDEVAEIATDDPVFARYLELNREVVALAGGDLEVGRALVKARPRRLRRLHHEWRHHEPSGHLIARIFLLNLGVWRERSGADPAELDEIERDLAARVEGRVRPGSISWKMAQAAFTAA